MDKPIKSSYQAGNWKLAPKDRKIVLNVAMVVAWLALGLGLFAGYAFYYTLRDSLESPDWPSVKGIVTESSLRMTTNRSGHREARIEYRYEVSGILHSNGRVAAKLSGESAGAILSRYPKGAEVTVYYHPGDPGRSLLEPGFDKQKAIPGIAFVVVLEAIVLAAIWACWYLYRAARDATFDGTHYVVFSR